MDDIMITTTNILCEINYCIAKTLAVKSLANKDCTEEVWQKKLWQIEVHLHRECYGNSYIVKIGKET